VVVEQPEEQAEVQLSEAEFETEIEDPNEAPSSPTLPAQPDSSARSYDIHHLTVLKKGGAQHLGGEDW
jgi:hypothetical protein